jgi:hypothetical protein
MVRDVLKISNASQINVFRFIFCISFTLIGVYGSFSHQLHVSYRGKFSF